MEKQKSPKKAEKYTQKQFSELGEQFVPLYAVPKGGFFRLTDSYTAPVWVRGDYDRSDNKYSAYQYENVNKESFFNGTRKVWVGFYF